MKLEGRRQSDNVVHSCLGKDVPVDGPEAAAALACNRQVEQIRLGMPAELERQAAAQKSAHNDAHHLMDPPTPPNTMADVAFEGRYTAYTSLRQRLERDQPLYPLTDDPETQSGYFVTDIKNSIFGGKASPDDSFATRLEQFKRLIGTSGTVDARNMMDD